MMNNCFCIWAVMNTITVTMDTKIAFLTIARVELFLSHPGWPVILVGPFIFNCIIDQVHAKVELKFFAAIVPANVFLPGCISNTTLRQEDYNSVDHMDDTIKEPEENTEVIKMSLNCC